jgi:hypothetical protein
MHAQAMGDLPCMGVATVSQETTNDADVCSKHTK